MRGNAVLHFIKFKLGLEQPHSQTTKAEQEAIARYASGALNAVEIGVYEGVNTVLIAAQLGQGGKLFAIDPFFKGRLGICYHEKIARQQIKKLRLGQKVHFISKLSFDAWADVPASGIDFIFVDGDHSLEGITKDWALFADKVKPGGYIALHDTSVPMHDPSVANLGSYKYFTSTIKQINLFKVVQTVDSLNVLQRV